MQQNFLSSLLSRYRQYSSDSIDPLGDLISRYRQYKNTRMLDLASVAISLGAQPDSVSEIDPLALRALHETNPSFDPEQVGSYSSQEWMGIVNSAKGKYFEHLVAKELNSGGTVGDLSLPEGYSVRLAESMTQPGWDLEIVDNHGQTAELLQLKATTSIGYIRDTLDRYPNIEILTTHEVAHGLGANDMVIDSNMSESDLESAISDAAGSDHGYLNDFWDHFHPLMPLLVIAATQGYQVVINKQQIRGAIEVAKARAARGVVSSAAGAAIKMASGSWLASVLGAITVGMAFDRSQNIDELISALKQRNRLLVARVNHYQTLLGRT